MKGKGMIRPSSLTMLAACPQFESGGSSEFADAGTARHKALAELFNDYDGPLLLLPEEEQEGVRWAADYIRCHAPMADYPCEWETKREWTRPDWTTGTGTPDMTCGPTLFDLKWRRRDYTAQMADYCLHLFERGYAEVTVHVLFAESKRAEVYKLDRPAAEAIVANVLGKVGGPPSPCDYCGWCARKLTCPALVRPATAVAHGYSDGQLGILNWHPAQMETAEEINTALQVARVVSKWCESVEHHAKEAVTKRGLELPGFKLLERQGRQYISDVLAAYHRSGLDAPAFLSVCEPRLNSSKTDPEKLGLIDVYAAAKQLPKAAAKRDLLKALDEVVKRGKPTVSLVAKDEAPF